MKHLIVISDLHINSTVGLCDSSVALDDGGSYHPSKSQLWLLDCWRSFWNSVHKLEGDKIVVINGDAVDLNTHNQYQLITTNKASIIEHAYNLIPSLNDYQRFLIRGTGAHVGQSGELEDLLGARLETVASPQGNYSWWSLPIEVEGVLFDISHHGRIGHLPWNRTSPLNTLAASISFEALKHKTRIPDVVIRSHNHLHADTHDNLPTRVIATPAWQLSTEYSYRLGIVEMADIGGLIFSCENGQYTLTKKLYKPEANKVVKL